MGLKALLTTPTLKRVRQSRETAMNLSVDFIKQVPIKKLMEVTTPQKKLGHGFAKHRKKSEEPKE